MTDQTQNDQNVLMEFARELGRSITNIAHRASLPASAPPPDIGTALRIVAGLANEADFERWLDLIYQRDEGRANLSIRSWLGAS